jgi:hypothetical protein
MPISSSQVLNTSSSFYSSIVEAFLLGQNTGSNNLLNLKTGTTQASTLSGGASLGSDVDGDYVQVTSTSSSERRITTSVNRSDSAYTFICTAKLDTNSTPANFGGMFALTNSANGGLGSLQYEAGAPVWYHNNGTFAALGNGVTTSTSFTTYVIVWTGTLLKFFSSIYASQSISYTSAPLTGAAAYLRVGNERVGVSSWPGKYYFFARINSALSDVDAQSIANNVSQLLASPLEVRITWAEAQYQASGAPVTPTDYSEPLSRGIFRGIERGVA